MAVLNRARAPSAVEGSSWCPTRPSTPGFYALVTRRTGPSRDHAAFKAHQTQATSTWWGSAPIQFVGMVSIDDRPEDVDDRRAPRALGG